MFRIRKVDADDEEVAWQLRELHDATFGDTAPQITQEQLDAGQWWLAYNVCKRPVAFAGLTRSQLWDDVGYLCRSGVMPEARGNNLQVRMIKVREAQAKRNGWRSLITDTTDNLASANSLIKAGFKLYQPYLPWAMSNSLYWRKWL
jgi:GNAT superfamily N-acetyltransferase